MTLDTFFEKFSQFADAPSAVTKMRELVLELAVRGRLIASGDGTTCVSPGPFPIPSHWRWATLKDAAEPCGQKKPDARFTYVDVGAIDNVRGRITDAVQHLEASEAPSRARKLVKPGSVLYSTVRPYLRNIAVFERQFTPAAIVSTAFAVLHPRSILDVHFLFFWLRSPSFQQEVSEKMKGVAYPAISDSELWRCPVPVPPLAEQKQVVTKVDELLALCDRLEAQQQDRKARHAVLARAALARFAGAPTTAHLRFVFHPSYAITPADLRKTILTLAVQGKLVPQDPKDEPVEASVTAARRKAHLSPINWGARGHIDKPLEVPESWRWVTVADVAESRLGKMLDHDKNRGKAHPYLRNTNVHWFRFELESVKTMLFERSELNEYRVDPGDVLICEGGHGIARSAVWNGQVPGILFQKALHRVRPLSCLNGHFLTFCLWVYEQELILQRYYTGAGIPHFTGKALARVTFPIPPVAEQRRIVARVDELMAMVDQLEAQLSASRVLAANLLAAAVAELTSSE